MASNMVLKVSLMLALMCFFLCSAMCNIRIPNEENIPPGPYKSTCWGCVVAKDDDDDLLTCQCELDNGLLEQTWYYLDGSCYAFKNSHGELVCDKELENEPNVPKGPYQDSCGGCSFNAETGMLTCTRCRDKTGELYDSELKVTEGCIIKNNEGSLECGVAPPPPPPEDPVEKAEGEGKFEL